MGKGKEIPKSATPNLQCDKFENSKNLQAEKPSIEKKRKIISIGLQNEVSNAIEPKKALKDGLLKQHKSKANK